MRARNEMPRGGLLTSGPASYYLRAGNLPFVRENVTLVILAIIVISVLPAVYESDATAREARRARPGQPGSPRAPVPRCGCFAM